MKPIPLVQVFASRFSAYLWAVHDDRNDLETVDKRVKEISEFVEEFMPSGSGFDNGTKFDYHGPSDRLTFHTSFHHMDEHGGYDGWTEHTVTVRPTFGGFALSISGRNRNDIKTYIADIFDNALNTPMVFNRDISEYEPARTPAEPENADLLRCI